MIPLFFDLDGTLIDTNLPHINGPKYKETLSLLSHYTNEINIEQFRDIFQQFNKRAVNISFEQASKKLFCTFREKFGVKIPNLPDFIALRKELRKISYRKDANFLDKGDFSTADVLKDLKRKFNLYLVTTAKRNQIIEASMNKNLFIDSQPISIFFADKIIAYEDVLKHKPDPECYNKALSLEKTRKLKNGIMGIVFEDSIIGVKSASKVPNNDGKLFIIGVCSYFSSKELIDAGADMTIKSVCDTDLGFIEKILQELN